MSPRIHFSIVSHRQAPLVTALLADLGRLAHQHDFRISILSNVPETAPEVPTTLAGRVEHVTSDARRGFGANHNRVFRRCEAPFFCVLNPDLRLLDDPLPLLLAAFADTRIGVAAPAAIDPAGRVQDNARRLPTPWSIASKLWSAPAGPDYDNTGNVVDADWVAGFFMLFRSSMFRELGGFDERYFLYYEDIDVCTRARLAGWKVAWVPAAKVMHDARRRSHRDPKYLLWHLRSIGRFFASPIYRAGRRLRQPDL